MSSLWKFLKVRGTRTAEPRTQADTAPDTAELSDDLLDHVAGGGNQPTATVESTGSIKTL
jgi:hypothetical protein